MLRTFSKITAVTEIVVVSGAENLALWKDELVKYNVKTACGGATRLESVRNGIAAVSPKADVIAVHDDARPLVRAETAWKCMSIPAFVADFFCSEFVLRMALFILLKR